MGETEPPTADSGTAGRSQAVREALEALRWHWGEAYEIWHDEGWHAKRLDGLGGVITAETAEELGTQISADYAMKAVPRDLPETAG